MVAGGLDPLGTPGSSESRFTVGRARKRREAEVRAEADLTFRTVPAALELSGAGAAKGNRQGSDTLSEPAWGLIRAAMPAWVTREGTGSCRKMAAGTRSAEGRPICLHGREGVSPESEGRWQHRPSCRSGLIWRPNSLHEKQVTFAMASRFAATRQASARARGSLPAPICGLSSFGRKGDPQRL